MYIIQGTATKSESKRIQLGHDVTTTGWHQYLIPKQWWYIYSGLPRLPLIYADVCN
jgi:hypothetical protein